MCRISVISLTFKEGLQEHRFPIWMRLALFLLNSYSCVITGIIKCNKSLTDIALGLINVVWYGSVDSPCFKTSSFTCFQYIYHRWFPFRCIFQLLPYDTKYAIQVNMYSKIIFTFVFLLQMYNLLLFRSLCVAIFKIIYLCEFYLGMCVIDQKIQQLVINS